MIQDLLDKNGLLDKDKCLKGMPFGLKAIIGPAIDYANKFDANNNKKPDVVEYMPFAVKILQILVAVAPYVDLAGVKAWFLSKAFVTDKVKVEKELANLEAVAAAAKTLADSK